VYPGGSGMSRKDLAESRFIWYHNGISAGRIFHYGISGGSGFNREPDCRLDVAPASPLAGQSAAMTILSQMPWHL
jgi:hypothetical protein